VRSENYKHAGKAWCLHKNSFRKEEIFPPNAVQNLDVKEGQGVLSHKLLLFAYAVFSFPRLDDRDCE